MASTPEERPAAVRGVREILWDWHKGQISEDELLVRLRSFEYVELPNDETYPSVAWWERQRVISQDAWSAHEVWRAVRIGLIPLRVYDVLAAEFGWWTVKPDEVTDRCATTRTRVDPQPTTP